MTARIGGLGSSRIRRRARRRPHQRTGEPCASGDLIRAGPPAQRRRARRWRIRRPARRNEPTRAGLSSLTRTRNFEAEASHSIVVSSGRLLRHAPVKQRVLGASKRSGPLSSTSAWRRVRVRRDCVAVGGATSRQAHRHTAAARRWGRVRSPAGPSALLPPRAVSTLPGFPRRASRSRGDGSARCHDA